MPYFNIRGEDHNDLAKLVEVSGFDGEIYIRILYSDYKIIVLSYDDLGIPLLNSIGEITQYDVIMKLFDNAVCYEDKSESGIFCIEIPIKLTMPGIDPHKGEALTGKKIIKFSKSDTQE